MARPHYYDISEQEVVIIVERTRHLCVRVRHLFAASIELVNLLRLNPHQEALWYNLRRTCAALMDVACQ